MIEQNSPKDIFIEIINNDITLRTGIRKLISLINASSEKYLRFQCNEIIKELVLRDLPAISYSI